MRKSERTIFRIGYGAIFFYHDLITQRFIRIQVQSNYWVETDQRSQLLISGGHAVTADQSQGHCFVTTLSL